MRVPVGSGDSFWPPVHEVAPSQSMTVSIIPIQCITNSRFGQVNERCPRAFQFSNARQFETAGYHCKTAPRAVFTQPPQGGFAPVARNFQLPGNEMIKL